MFMQFGGRVFLDAPPWFLFHFFPQCNDSVWHTVPETLLYILSQYLIMSNGLLRNNKTSYLSWCFCLWSSHWLEVGMAQLEKSDATRFCIFSYKWIHKKQNWTFLSSLHPRILQLKLLLVSWVQQLMEASVRKLLIVVTNITGLLHWLYALLHHVLAQSTHQMMTFFKLMTQGNFGNCKKY